MMYWFQLFSGLLLVVIASLSHAAPKTTTNVPRWVADASYQSDPTAFKFAAVRYLDVDGDNEAGNYIASQVSMWSSRGTKTIALLPVVQDEHSYAKISIVSAAYYPPYSEYKPHSTIAAFYADENKYRFIVARDGGGTINPGSFVLGLDMELVGDEVTGPMLFTNVYNQSAPHGGGIFYYRGLNSHWSVQQLLFVDSDHEDLDNDDDDTNLFGQSFGVDRLHFRALVAGAASYSQSYESEGVVFFYEATDPKAKGWTQQQIIKSKGYTQLGYSDTKIYGPTVIAGATHTTSTRKGILIFSQGPDKTWSNQQFLLYQNDPTSPYSSADIYDDVIVVGYAEATVHGITLKGAVNIYQSSPPVPGPHGRPKQWSLKQTLISPPPFSGDTYFGRKVALTGDDLFVGSSGNVTNTYFFHRVNGLFTLASRLCSEVTCDHPTVGKEVYDAIIVGQDAIVSYVDIDRDADPLGKAPPLLFGGFNGGSVVPYTKMGTSNSKCLRVSLGDHFGDGWDSAVLRVETPFGETDYFSNECDTLNPHVFRYCPSEVDKPGVYKFSIPDAPKAKFFWEIHWKVYLESENRWIHGDHGTELDFLWDPSKKQFNEGATKHAFGNATCTKCPPKPAPKGKGGPAGHDHRQLQGTTFPTYADDEWQYVQLSTATEDWFDEDHVGVYFYISDVKGSKLISKGTKCPNEEPDNQLNPITQCWQTLPDGDYVMRVGGALKGAVANTFDWAFCHIVGNEANEIAFKIRNGSATCQAKYRITAHSYCTDILHAYSVLEVMLYVDGVSVNYMSQLNTQDKLVISNAIKNSLGGVIDVDVISVYRTMSGTIFTIEVTASIEAAGYAGKDSQSLYGYSLAMENSLSYHADRIWGYLVSNTIQGSTIFMSSSFARLENFRLEKVIFDNPELSSQKEDMFTYQKVEDKYDSELVSTPNIQEVYIYKDQTLISDNEYVRMASPVGYVLIAVVGMLVVYVVGRKTASVISSKLDTCVSDASATIDNTIAPVNKLFKAKKSVAVKKQKESDSSESSSESSDSSESSESESDSDGSNDEEIGSFRKNRSALSVQIDLNDLKRMIKDEDEALAKAVKVGTM